MKNSLWRCIWFLRYLKLIKTSCQSVCTILLYFINISRFLKRNMLLNILLICLLCLLGINNSRKGKQIFEPRVYYFYHFLKIVQVLCLLFHVLLLWSVYINKCHFLYTVTIWPSKHYVRSLRFCSSNTNCALEIRVVSETFKSASLGFNLGPSMCHSDSVNT